MFATVPALSPANTTETRILNPSLLEEVKPHANVTADGIDTVCCEGRFGSGETIVILLSLGDMQSHLQALTGVVDEFGNLSAGT